MDRNYHEISQEEYDRLFGNSLVYLNLLVVYLEGPVVPPLGGVSPLSRSLFHPNFDDFTNS